MLVDYEGCEKNCFIDTMLNDVKRSGSYSSLTKNSIHGFLW